MNDLFMENKYLKIVAVIVFLAVAIGLSVYKDIKDKKNTNVVSVDTSLATNKNVNSTGVTFKAEPIFQNVPVPNLKRDILFTDKNLTASQKEKITQDIEKVLAELKANSTQINSWLELGLLRESTGDYEGAKEAWVYITKVSPNNYIAYSNLGNLYQYYLKDNLKAEEYFKKALVIKPDYTLGYQNLYDLYTLSYKEKIDQVPVVLKQGLAKNPEDYNLNVILAGYYSDLGNKTEAKTYYTKALEIAIKTGNQATIQAIQTELNKLGN